MQDKNFIGFIIASSLILMAWFMFFAEKPKPPDNNGGDGIKAGSTVDPAGGNTLGLPTDGAADGGTPAGLAGNTSGGDLGAPRLPGKVEPLEPAKGDTAPASGDTVAPLPGNTAAPISGNTAAPVPGDTAAPISGNTAAPVPGDTAAPVPGDTAAPVPGDTSAPLPGSTAKKPALTAAEDANTIRVVTDVVEAVFTARGAAPESWKLLNYPTEKCFPYRVDIAWPPFKSSPPCDTSPVDMVDQRLPDANIPFLTQVSIDSLVVAPNALWEAASDDLVLSEGDTMGEISFKRELSDGRTLYKTFRFRPGRYDVDLTFTVEGGPKPKSANADISLYYAHDPYSKGRVPRWNFNGPEMHNGEVIDQTDPDDVIDEGMAGMSESDLKWAGYTSDYFLEAVVARDDYRLAYVMRYVGTKAQAEDKKSIKPMAGWVRANGSSELFDKGTALTVRLYMGPKEKQYLAAADKTLRDSIDYGMLWFMVKPLLAALVFINRFIGNYGVSIIVLTIILRMGMFPLTRKGQKSMKQMQKLQPEIQKIREKYPDDRVKQNEEMQNIWKRNQINPMMGCLPMLLQIPVFFAFYKALLISIELRQADFFWWIIDLTARDPLYIWPVLMGGTQLAMQKMTPSQMDPMQQKLFLLMPIVFTYILRDFPSGLLVYWTFSNLVGVAQQLYVNRQPD